jgi:hypothetical protein
MNLGNKKIYCSSKEMLKCIENCYNTNNNYEYLNNMLWVITKNKHEEIYLKQSNIQRILIIELLLFKERIECMQLHCHQNNNISIDTMSFLFGNVVDVYETTDCNKIVELFFDFAIKNAKKYEFATSDKYLFIEKKNNICPAPPPNSPQNSQ